MASRWWVPAAAAVAVAAIGAGVAFWPRGDGAGPVAAAPPTPSRAAADPLVRDGAEVVVSGQVVALPGRPVRMCAPLPVSLPAYAPGHEPLPSYCTAGVTVRGLDLAAISDRTVDRGVVTGQARVQGRYAAGVVTVTRQDPPEPYAERPSSLTERPPCAPPPGGWRPGEADLEPLTRYLAAHPDRYVDPWVTYPDGYPKSEGGATPQAHTTVAVAGTVLDPAAVEAELRKVHPGNLCVVRVPRPAATLTAVMGRLTADDTGFREHGVWSTSPDGISGRVDVELVVLDAAAKRWLSQVDDRTGTVTPHPWVRPVR